MVLAIQIACALSAFPLGYMVVNWMAAEHPTMANGILSDCESGVMNHGHYHRWPLGTVADHPLLFGMTVTFLFITIIIMVLLAIHFKRSNQSLLRD